MEIKDLQLTEADFNMLVEALDALPEKGAMGELMGDMVDMITADRKNSLEQNMLKEKLERKRTKSKRDNEVRMEDIRVLQGKLIQLKRFLLQEGAMKQANDILNK
jgi:hypothetical protein